jgi:hypothetical protein
LAGAEPSIPKSNISFVFIHKPYSPAGMSFFGVIFQPFWSFGSATMSASI